jgi:Arc/MetJ-type ribon-helix-helix transcriptional regulator
MAQKTISTSIALHPRHIEVVDSLIEKRNKRLEYISRSALIREALNIGLKVLMEKESHLEMRVDGEL